MPSIHELERCITFYNTLENYLNFCQKFSSGKSQPCSQGLSSPIEVGKVLEFYDRFAESLRMGCLMIPFPERCIVLFIEVAVFMCA